MEEEATGASADSALEENLCRDGGYDPLNGIGLKAENSVLVRRPLSEPATGHVPHLSMLPLMQPMWDVPETETIQPPPGVTSVSPASEGTTDGPVSSPVSVPAPPSFVLLLLGMGIVVGKLRTAAGHKSSHRTKRGGSISADKTPHNGKPSGYPSREESIDRLHRSGWHLGVSVFTDSSGRSVWQVDGSRGENQIQGQGASRGEAWHRAVEAAAAVGMLVD